MLFRSYYLASVADKIIVNPQGSIAWHGLASQPVFYKDLLKKVGVDMQIFKVGTYKSAVEPFIATEMSDANREQVSAFLNSIWSRLLEDISASRDIPVETLNRYADEMMDFQPAETYIANGLADTLMYKDGVLAYLKEMSGREEDEDLRTLSLEDMKNVKRNVPLDKSETSSPCIMHTAASTTRPHRKKASIRKRSSRTCAYSAKTKPSRQWCSA